jgi:hypothetical protein
MPAVAFHRISCKLGEKTQLQTRSTEICPKLDISNFGGNWTYFSEVAVQEDYEGAAEPHN